MAEMQAAEPVKLHMRNQKGICGAKGKRSGLPCRGIPMKNGRCRLHGGKTPRDIQKNSLLLRNHKSSIKTGEGERMFFNAFLSEEEKQIVDELENRPFIKQLEDEIKLATIRERRMIERIEKLRREPFFVSQIVEESGRVKKEFKTNENSLIMIEKIEEGLTRVQEKKLKLLELKNRYEMQTGQENADLSPILDALSAAAGEVWDDGGAAE